MRAAASLPALASEGRCPRRSPKSLRTFHRSSTGDGRELHRIEMKNDASSVTAPVQTANLQITKRIHRLSIYPYNGLRRSIHPHESKRVPTLNGTIDDLELD